jgi:hypothetical protein
MIRFTRDENAARIQIPLISVDRAGVAPHLQHGAPNSGSKFAA